MSTTSFGRSVGEEGVDTAPRDDAIICHRYRHQRTVIKPANARENMQLRWLTRYATLCALRRRRIVAETSVENGGQNQTCTSIVIEKRIQKDGDTPIGVANYRALGHVPPVTYNNLFFSVHFDLYKV